MRRVLQVFIQNGDYLSPDLGFASSALRQNLVAYQALDIRGWCAEDDLLITTVVAFDFKESAQCFFRFLDHRKCVRSRPADTAKPMVSFWSVWLPVLS